MAAKAVVVSREKIFEKLTALQVPLPKRVNTKKNMPVNFFQYFLPNALRSMGCGVGDITENGINRTLS